MQTNTVGVEYRRKFNLGNYESLELSISLYAKVDLDEDPDAVVEFLWNQAKESVNTQAAPVLESANYKAQKQHKIGGMIVEDGDLKEF